MTRCAGASRASSRPCPCSTAILFLADLKELRIEEIAQVLDITPGAAKIRLHRARRALKARMESGCRISLDERGELNCGRRSPGSTGDRNAMA